MTDAFFRTIHGMVYNAMKLFMEINPQLFDDCSHEYNEIQEGAQSRQQKRDLKWKALEEAAKRAQTGGKGSAGSKSRLQASPKVSKIGSPMRIDEVDPMTQESQRRLDSLRLSDEAKLRDHHEGRERKMEEQKRKNSVGSSRSQR